MSCYGLLDAEKANNRVAMLCKVPKVSRSGYYDWTVRVHFKREDEAAVVA